MNSYYILFDLDSTFDDIIPQILLVTQNLTDLEDYIYDLGYEPEDVAQYPSVVSFINKNSDELDLVVVQHYNK